MNKLLFFGIIIFLLLIIQKDTENMDLDAIIIKLTRQAARWSTASKQDENPMIAVLHANYGAGYLWALKDIATNEQIKKATGINMITFEKEIIRAQDEATKKMVKVCPEYGPLPNYLTKIAGEK